jgi:hypothetical protein
MLGHNLNSLQVTVVLTIMALRYLLQPLKFSQSSTWHLVITPDPRRYKGFQVRWLPSLFNSLHCVRVRAMA